MSRPKKKLNENPFLQEESKTVLANETVNEKEKSSLNEVDENKLNDLKQSYIEEVEKKPRKKRTTKDEVNQAENFAKSASMAVHIGLNIIVTRMPKPQALSVDEEKAFDEAFTNFAKKYYNTIERFGEEINFLMVLGFILIPRLEFRKKKDETENNSNIRKNRNGQVDISEQVNSE